MTTLPSLITHPVNSGAVALLSDVFHLGVVSSSQSQSPDSMASMLTNRMTPAGSLWRASNRIICCFRRASSW